MFFLLKQLNTFDHPYCIHKYLASEPLTFLLADRYIISNKFDKDIQLTYDNDLHRCLILFGQGPQAPGPT